MFLLLPETRRERAGTDQHQNVKNGAAQKSWRLPMYHGGYQVYDHEIFYDFLILFILSQSVLLLKKMKNFKKIYTDVKSIQ